MAESLNRRGQLGFSLIELMVVVAIIGILAAIGYPAYQNYVRESRRADAYAALTTAIANQERYYSDNNTYSTDLVGDLGYTNPAESPDGYYALTATACGGGIGECVQISADPQGAQTVDTDCDPITLDSTGARGPNNACWNK